MARILICTLILAVMAACASQAPTQSAASTADAATVKSSSSQGEKVVADNIKCTGERATGSHMRKKRCTTEEQRQQEKMESETFLRGLTGKGDALPVRQ